MKSKRAYEMTGRAAAAAATKARIRAAAVALYTAQPIETFTLDDVAARAETTVQTILRGFGSKDALIYEALGDMASDGIALKPTPQGDVAAAVRAFHDIYEAMGDLVMQRLSDEQRRPALKAGLDAGRKNHRDGVKTAFASELKAVSGSKRTQLLTILVVATDVYVWKLLRRDMAMSRNAAEAIVCRMIEGALGEQQHGKHSVVELVGRRQSAT